MLLDKIARTNHYLLLMLAVQLHATAAFGSATESGMLIDHPLLRRGVLGSGYSTMLLVVLIDI